MNIKEIADIKVWNNFFNENGSLSFLQSWEWGEVQKREKYKVLRLGLFDKKIIKAIAQIVKIRSKRGNFLFIPHGPIMTTQNSKSIIQNYIKTLRDYLINIAKDEGFAFIRVAPILENTLENKKLFADLDFRKAPIYMHSERSWILNVTCEVERLLANMRKTTRYLIRKAERDDIVIEKRSGDTAIDDFYKIFQETAFREHFTPYSKEFIRAEFEEFNKTGNAVFLFGKLKADHNYLASALVVFTKSGGFYHQGASIHTKLPVTYLLQWEAIKEAKGRGCQFYNFWGILQKGRTPKNWSGITLFKTGFGGQQIDYVSTQDYIIFPRYYLTYLYEKFLAWRRGV